MKYQKFLTELIKCKRSFSYFVNKYVWIENPQVGGWSRFKLWPEQEKICPCLHHRQIVALKARQLGWSWFFLAEQLYEGIFSPGTQHLIFSRRDEEAKDLLRRIKGMYERLPYPFRNNEGEENTPRYVKDDVHNLELDNHSRFKAFPCTAGDSYTASIALIDEADLQENLGSLLRSVKPTIDNGGKLRLISRSNKDDSNSEFKRIYRAARDTNGETGWKAIFAPWQANPTRTQEWYNLQVKECEARTGSIDFVYEHYPNSDEEALLPRILNTRFPPQWFGPIYEELDGEDDITSIPGLVVWKPPGKVKYKDEYGQDQERDEQFVLGVDVAEGNEDSNDSSVEVLDEFGEQRGKFTGRIEITVFAEYVYKIHKYFNDAEIFVERNNHGHAVILRLLDREDPPKLMRGKDKKYGWQTNGVSKAEMFSSVADGLREKTVIIHCKDTKDQLMSIERNSLAAPEGKLDDLAVAYAIAVVGVEKLNLDPGEFKLF